MKSLLRSAPLFLSLSLFFHPSIATAGTACATAPLTENDSISFLERRLEADPDDFLTECRLIGRYFAESKRTGDISLVTRYVPRLDAILKEFPTQGSALTLRAAAAMTLHDFKHALDLADLGLRSSPRSLAFLAARADALLELGRYDEAGAAFAVLDTMESTDPSLMARRARYAQMTGDAVKAESLLKAAVATLNDDTASSGIDRAWYHLMLGKFYFSGGRFAEAEAAYNTAADQCSDWWMVKDFQAELLGARRRFSEAEKLFSEAYDASKRPEIAQAIGDLIVASGDPQRAETFFDAAQKGYDEASKNGFKYYLHHEAHFYADSRLDATKAIALAQEDVTLRKTVDAYDGLAWAYYRSGAMDKAAETIRPILERGLHNPHVLYHAAMIEGAVGHAKKSKELLAAAAKINPEFMQFHVHR